MRVRIPNLTADDLETIRDRLEQPTATRVPRLRRTHDDQQPVPVRRRARVAA